ncbi:transcription initiation factor tfiid subunit 13 [Moniliophthora roreri MCA 2997]|uniref:Transcription initiation factor TFIID subunit 13 n=2 Tax=Moniliophthora roreri TaxID=221103 RepID=V2YZ71_MONRO|nr:transcription initiation factor tfiid subunit 13 [Moniliophthora roreri MCA 2997]
MSYHHYTPQATTTQPTATYPYGAYTAYPYPQTGYQWPYAYPYGVQTQTATTRPTATTPTAATGTNPSTATVATAASSTPVAPAQIPRSTTFTSYTPSYVRDAGASVASGSKGNKKQSNIKGLFNKELRNLMYGFGDDRNPANDTVNVMEEILIEYITDVCQAAAGGPNRKTRLSIEDLRRALSRPADAKKLARMEELLFMQEDIKRARAQFEESDMQNSRGAFS